MNNLKISETRKGEIYLIIHVLFWAMFPIITKFTIVSIPPIFSAALGTMISSVFFFFIFIYNKSWIWLNNISVWKNILWVTIINWIIFYWLLFYWISKTSAWNVAIFWQSEVFFTFLIFEFLLWEKSPKKHIIWAILMIIWIIIVLFPKDFNFNIWDLIIIFANMLCPFWNYFTQQARKQVDGITIMFIRSLVSWIFLFILWYFIVWSFPLITEVKNSFYLLLITWILLLWFAKLLFIEAIHRISVPKAIFLSIISPVFTLIFAFYLLNEIPTFQQIIGLIPIMFWVVLIMRK